MHWTLGAMQKFLGKCIGLSGQCRNF